MSGVSPKSVPQECLPKSVMPRVSCQECLPRVSSQECLPKSGFPRVSCQECLPIVSLKSVSQECPSKSVMSGVSGQECLPECHVRSVGKIHVSIRVRGLHLVLHGTLSRTFFHTPHFYIHKPPHTTLSHTALHPTCVAPSPFSFLPFPSQFICLLIIDRRKFRNEISDNMDRWKSGGGKSQGGEEKK